MTSRTERLLAPLRRITTSGAFIAEIDGLRFIAIASVLLFHLAVDLSIKSPVLFARPEGGLFAQAVWNGFRGVELFFVISGFILGMPFAAHALEGKPKVKLGQYFLRRVTRLEPPYVLAMVLLFALQILVRGRSFSALLPHLGASLVYVHNLVFGTESTINNVSWSLEIEIQFYLLAPLLSSLFFIRPKALRRLLIAGLCLALAALSAIFIPPETRAALSILRFAHFFLLGFLLADVFLTDWNGAPSKGAVWDALSLAGWPLLFYFWSAGTPQAGNAMGHESLAAAMVAPVAVFFLYVAAFRGPLTNRLIGNPWVATVGGMCYTIYLLHNPALALILSATKGLAPAGSYAVNLLLQLLVTTPLLLIPCVAFFVLVEKPCMRRDWPKRLLDFIAGRRSPARAG